MRLHQVKAHPTSPLIPSTSFSLFSGKASVCYQDMYIHFNNPNQTHCTANLRQLQQFVCVCFEAGGMTSTEIYIFSPDKASMC